MKKNIRLISTVLIFAILLSAIATLTSCRNVKDVLLWSRISERMDALSSYRLEYDVYMIFYVDEKQVHSTDEGVQIESKGEYSDDYYFYSSTLSTVRAGELGIEEQVRGIEAYNEGSYYVYQDGFSNETTRLRGEMGVEDFRSYIEKRGNTAVDVSAAKKISRSRERGGISKVEYSGFSEYEAGRVMRSFGMDAGLFGFKVKDLVLTVTYDREYRITAMDYVFEFDVYEKAKNKPAAVIRAQYSDYDSAQREYESIDPKNYTEVDGINVLVDTSLKLNALKGATEGKFQFYTAQYLDPSPSQNWMIEVDDVTYGYRDGGFYYNIVSDTQGYKFKIDYANGEQTVKVQTITDRNKQTDEEARAFIDGMIDSLNIMVYNIVSITETEPAEDYINDIDETYVIELTDRDPTVYKQIAESFGYSGYLGVDHKIRVAYSQGKLVWVSSEIVLPIGEAYSIRVSRKITFKD